MKIFIEKDQKDVVITFNGLAKDLLSNLNINFEEVLIVRNGNLVIEDEILSDDDIIQLLSVVSGG